MKKDSCGGDKGRFPSKSLTDLLSLNKNVLVNLALIDWNGSLCRNLFSDLLSVITSFV